jgi:hypothetical protein
MLRQLARSLAAAATLTLLAEPCAAAIIPQSAFRRVEAEVVSFDSSGFVDADRSGGSFQGIGGPDEFFTFAGAGAGGIFVGATASLNAPIPEVAQTLTVFGVASAFVNTFESPDPTAYVTADVLSEYEVLFGVDSPSLYRIRGRVEGGFVSLDSGSNNLFHTSFNGTFDERIPLQPG